MELWILKELKSTSLQGINVKLLKIIKLINRTSDVPLLLILMLTFFILAGQALCIFFGQPPLMEIFANVFTMVVSIKFFLRLLALLGKEEEFVAFIQLVDDLQKLLEETGDKGTLKIVRKATRLCQLISNFNLGLKLFAGFATALKGILIRKLLYLIWLPLVDIDVLLEKGLFFEILLIIQGFVYTPLALMIYTIFMNLPVVWLIFGIALIKNLCYNLQQVNYEKDDKAKCEAMKKCIRSHNAIIKYCDEFQKVMATLIFLDFLLFILLCCLELFLLYTADDPMLKFTIFSYVFNTSISILLPYWFAHELMDQSLKVADAAYAIDWYDGSFSLRKMIFLMILRSQKPIKMSYSGISPMTLETVQKLLKTSYSVFAMMQTMHAK